VHQQKRFGTSYKTFMQGNNQKKKKKLKQITTSQISKKKIEVSSFALIVKEYDMLNLNVLIQGLKEMTLKKKI
jgi:hypothetical protein